MSVFWLQTGLQRSIVPRYSFLLQSYKIVLPSCLVQKKIRRIVPNVIGYKTPSNLNAMSMDGLAPT